jgi:C-terminal processing protease CtpA/Prc
MRATIITTIFFATAAGLIGYSLRPATEAPVRSSDNMAASTASRAIESLDADAGVEDLRQAIQAEAAARQALEKELAKVKRQVAALTKKGGAASQTADEDMPEGHQAMLGGEGGDEAWFNEQALVDAGIDVAVAGQMKQDFENLEMEKLYLRDQASREGWLRTQRFFEEVSQLNERSESIRDQYGEDAYDAYLYATGAPNRVEVRSVLESAPAGTAGIQAGDHIISYDNQRIYTGQALREATAQGAANEVVLVEVERNGEHLQFYLPRGPMGIRMDSISVAP